MSKSDFLLTKWDNCMAAVGAVLRNRHVQKAWEANPLYKMLDGMEDDLIIILWLVTDRHANR